MRPKLGFAMCGSFCTHEKALSVMKSLSENYEITPVLSGNAASIDTRFGKSAALVERVRAISGNDPVLKIEEAEKLGPATPLDYMIICPCTGNTVAKLASGITDTSVTMAAKAHLRSDRPLLIALATNDALSANFINIGCLMQRKNIFFVPMIQDDISQKPHSLVADFSQCEVCVEAIRFGQQIRPLFL